MHNLSDEMLCDRWVENPDFQYFCGEVVFRHEAPFDRSSLTRWRQRLGEEQIAALLQESLSVAHRTGAIESKDLERVVVDTTVQEKAIAHPTDARLTHRGDREARRDRPNARASSYARVICAWPNARPLWWGAIRMPTSSSALGGNSNSCARDLAASSATFAARSRPMPHGRIALVRCSILHCGFAIKSSANADQRSTHGTPPRWSASAAARHGRRTSSAARCRLPRQPPRPKADSSCCMPRRSPHGNPYDGHTLGPVITDLEKLTGVAVRRIHGDKGYRGHNYPDRFRVWISGQVRRVTKVIRREMRRRAAVEPVIGHLKDDHRMRRNYLKGRDGDRINAVLAAAGYNFSLLLRWFEELLRVLLLIICRSRAPRLCLASLALGNILHGRLNRLMEAPNW